LFAYFAWFAVKPFLTNAARTMKNSVSTARIALVGDQSTEVKAHAAIPRALALAADSLHIEISTTWMPTKELAGKAASQLSDFQGIWCVPGGPYASMDGALAAIRFARENNIPFLGTCGGFQHALIEYSRNVLGITNADHAESNPDARFPLIAPLACALRETEIGINLHANSRARAIYGSEKISETFNCGYGLKPEHHHLFADGGLRITGFSDDQTARIVELNSHPFFMATLFQPERSAFKNVTHPLIVTFAQATLRL
jgi:CTP synthase (UTP-ammonia lyase)